MEDSPIFYNNSNKPLSKAKIIEKKADYKKSILEKLSKYNLKQVPGIEKSANYKRKPYINPIRIDSRPEIKKIDKEMDKSGKKMLSEINSFKEILYNYNKDKKKQMDNFGKLQQENNKFSKIYNRIQKEKNKFNTGTYLDYKAFINISRKYISKNISIPNLSKEHSIFTGNPLILSGSELKDYFYYNLGNKNKSINFLNKVDELVTRKKNGDEEMTKPEIEHLKKIIKKEKPKGYISPKIMIPKLKKDILKSKNTCENLNNIENFFKEFDNKRKINDYFSSYKNRNRSAANSYNSDNEISKLNMSKNNINNLHMSKRDFQKYKNFLNNSSTTETTDIFCAKKSSIDYTVNSNVSNIVTQKKSSRLKFSPLTSPFGRQYNNHNFEESDRKIDLKKNFNLVQKMREFSPIKNNNKISKKNIIQDLNEKIKILKEEKSINKINRSKNSISLPLIKNDFCISIDKKDDCSNGSGKKELSELIIDIEQKRVNSPKNKIQNIFNIDKIRKEMINDNKIGLNLSLENDKSEVKKKKKEKTKNKILRIRKSYIIKPYYSLKLKSKTPIKKINESDRYNNIENLFNKVINSGFNSDKNKKELEKYANSRGKIIKINKKDNYYNILRAKEKVSDNNLILEEYIIRNGTNNKKFFAKKQKDILEKNNLLINEMINQEMKIKEILCEDKINK